MKSKNEDKNMNRKNIERKPIKNFWIYAVAVAIAMMFLIPGSAVVANESDVVKNVQSIINTIEQGETFDVDVYVDSNIQLVSGIAIDFIYFDETLLQANSVTYQNFFDPASTFTMPG